MVDKNTSIAYANKKINDLTVERELTITQLKKQYWDRIFQINTAIDKIIATADKKQIMDLRNARDTYEKIREQIENKYS
ncbi:MAG: hypothetical protein LBV22_02985 [Mycoplasmataceae bacterium]|nr:hypothetical protein [Mycoplasmataceae bacterium]